MTVKKYRKKPVIIEAMRFWGDVETFHEAEEFTEQVFNERDTVTLLLKEEFPITPCEVAAVSCL